MRVRTTVRIWELCQAACFGGPPFPIGWAPAAAQGCVRGRGEENKVTLPHAVVLLIGEIP